LDLETEDLLSYLVVKRYLDLCQPAWPRHYDSSMELPGLAALATSF
jgi:hypothetical protein